MNKLGIVAAGSLLSLGAFAADEGVTLGGYVDAGYRTVMQDQIGGGDVDDTNGFLVREAGIYIGKKWGTEWEVFSDIAYRETVDTGLGGNNGVAVGVDQAFVANVMENGFGWKLGRFDTVYGYYAGRGDSHAHRLTDTGYIQGAYLPNYHLGWLGSYSFSDMLKFSLLVANDNEDFGTSAGIASFAGNSGTRRADFGFLVNADFDTFGADLGAYFMTGEDNAGSGDSKLGYVISAVFEGNFNPLMVGVYGVYSLNDADDLPGQDESADFGIGTDVGFDLNEQAGLNLRIEYIDSSDKASVYSPVTGTWFFIGAGEVKNVLAGTVGGHWKFNDNVKAKFDYTYANVDVDGFDVDPFHIVNAGVVANF